MIRLLTAFALLLLLAGCQSAKEGNTVVGSCDQSSVYAYPPATGQQNIFTFLNVSEQKNYYDDGYYQQGVIRNFLPANNNVVVDANYNLTWQDNTAAAEQNLSGAQNYCEALNLNGYDDWRLPNIYELLTLVNLGSSTNSRESRFNHMPFGTYYSSNALPQAGKVVVVRFGQNDFNLSYISQNTESQLTPYGILIAEEVTPAYSAGVIVKVTTTKTYLKGNTTTTVETIKTYDDTTGLLLSDNTFIGFEQDANPVVVQNDERYVKCVRGEILALGRFVRDDLRNVVTDTQTNMMWQDDLSVVTERLTWGEAVQYCKNLDFAGFGDWRLPNITELTSIVNYLSESDYALHGAFKHNCACKYHSSSNFCFGNGCLQGNYQLNTCGALPQRVQQNLEIDQNPYDENTTEPFYRVRCVRCGSGNSQ